MPLDTLTLVLSTDGVEIPLGTFVDAIMRFRSLVDALSLEVGASAIEWDIDDLSRGSNLVAIRGRGNGVERVVQMYGEVGVAMQENKPVRHSQPVKRAAARLRLVAGGKVESLRLETPEREAIVRPRPTSVPPVVLPQPSPPRIIPAPVVPAIQPALSALGAVDGRVQTLTNRGGLRFTLYDTLNDKAVSCYLLEGREDIMRDAWGRLAVVEGLVARDPLSGRPLTVRRVAYITILPDRVPGNYRTARGAAPSLSGLSAEQAIRLVRDA